MVLIRLLLALGLALVVFSKKAAELTGVSKSLRIQWLGGRSP
jgi:hypothetical protein